MAGDQYWPELEAALTANTAPDVFYLGLGDIKKRVWAEKIVPLDDLLDTSSLGKIWPDALDLNKYDLDTNTLGEGNIYALPKDFSAVSMTVNRAIIEKRRAEIEALVSAGTLPFFPEIDANGNLPVYTFTEFATLCKTLTFEDPTLPETAGSKQVYGTHLWEDFTLQPFIWGAGGEYLTDSSYFPESRAVFVNMLKGQNGKRVPTSYTFNGLWHSDGFISGVDAVWSHYEKSDKGVTPMSASDYLRSIQTNAQALLDQAISDEADVNPN